MPGVYDPETKLYIFGTGNPTPAYTGRARRGRQPVHLLAGRHQRRHRQDGVVTTRRRRTTRTTGTRRRRRCSFDALVNGKPRKLVVDRRAQRLLLHRRSRDGRAPRDDEVRHVRPTGPRASNKNGPCAGDPTRTRRSPARWSRRPSGGTINWQPPAYSPDTGLFYVPEEQRFTMLYLTDPDPRGSMGLGGKDARSRSDRAGNFLTAIDPATGKVAWRRPLSERRRRRRSVDC